jgi:hypothetical protein
VARRFGLEELTQQDVPVRERFFHDEGVGRVVGERVAEGGRFRGALRGVVVARGLDDAAELAVGEREARVRFLDVHLGELLAEGGFGEAEAWGWVSMGEWWKMDAADLVVLLQPFPSSGLCPTRLDRTSSRLVLRRGARVCHLVEVRIV